jgi:P4 family phage/plasmid primase-like protien
MTDSLITEPYAYGAVLYRQAGWLTPLPVVGKDVNLPDGFTGYEGRDAVDDDIARWMNDRGADNVCIRLPDDVIGIDVDAYDGRRGEETIEWWAENVGEPLPPTWRSTARDDGVSGIYLFRVPAGRRWRSHLGRDSNVEIVRRHHRYAVVWPSLHPNIGRRYFWYRPDGTISMDEVPDIEMLPTLPDAWVEALQRDAAGFETSTRNTGDHGSEDVETIDVDGQPVDVVELLRSGIPVGEQNEVLYRYLSSMRARGFKREEMLLLGAHVLQQSRTGDDANPWTQQDLSHMVDRVRSEYSPGTSTLDVLPPEFRGWAERQAQAVRDAGSGPALTEPPPMFEDATDMGNSLRFARIMKDRVRFVADENRWYVWDGIRWAPDQTQHVMELTKMVLVELRAELAGGAIPEDEQNRWMRWVRDSENLSRRKAMLVGASAETNLVVTANQLDTNPWLMVVRNGTVDLRTGLLRPSDPDDLCTHRAEVTYDADADCPEWKDHVKFITCGSGELAVYLMCMAGYSLTGLTSERSFYFLEGEGLNGKNVFVEPIMNVMGSYASTASTSLLTGGDEQHPTILADLRGRRFIFIDEVRQGKRLNVERIKALTGSKRIKARQMRENFFEFDAQFKLWLAGNGQPTVKDPSDGAWDRLKRVPFNARVPEDAIIKDRAQQLYDAEASGILNWLLAGARYWASESLAGRKIAVPLEVKAAVDEHRHDEDYIGQFLDEHPIVRTGRPGDVMFPEQMHGLYRGWAMFSEGLRPNEVVAKNAFSKEIVRRYDVKSERQRPFPRTEPAAVIRGLRWDKPSDITAWAEFVQQKFGVDVQDVPGE